MMRCWWLVLLVLLAPLAQAASVHAFLDRNHVSLGDTVTLNIQSDGPLGTPDLAPLQQDFQVLGTSSSSNVQIGNGRTVRTQQLGIALKPLHAGTLTIPSLDVGGVRTSPLTLQVGAAASGGSGKTGDPVFMQTSVLSSSPYVGQQTVYTVRVFYLPGVNGSLSEPTADGARLVKLDRDHSYMVDRDGYAYRVREYAWALIPQRAGAITIQGPTFQGQQLTAGNPGAWLNNPNALLNGQVPGLGAQVGAIAPAAHIDARAAPANAGQPWLPAQDVQLTLSGLPSDGKAKAGVPVTVTLSISASGQPADALPEPELPAIAGARVYPDQIRDSTDDSGQWLQGTRTRSFAIVPQRDGRLALPAITLNWWDVAHDRAAQASVPASSLQVSGAVPAPASAAPPPASSASPGQPSAPAASTVAAAPAPAHGGNPQTFWRNAALLSVALWLLAIVVAAVWWWVRRKAPARHADDPVSESGRVAPETATHAAADTKALQARALAAAQAGDTAACEHALLAWARAIRPDVSNATSLRAALSAPEQLEALDALQRARWQGGDGTAACAAIARAFAKGLAWRAKLKPDAGDASGLPPLYPS